MSILRHDHPLLKDKPESPHVDSRGHRFGEEEHVAASAAYEWPENEALSAPVEHRHKHIEERIDDGKVSWFHRPPGSREAEREIVAVGPGIKSGINQRGEDEEFES
jgi:hypothetical protein